MYWDLLWRPCTLSLFPCLFFLGPLQKTAWKAPTSKKSLCVSMVLDLGKINGLVIIDSKVS